MGFQKVGLLPEGVRPPRSRLPGKGGKRWGAQGAGAGEQGIPHHWCSAGSPQVNLLVPATYLVFWAFLLVFSFISEPMVCGVGVIIILTGVPVFFLGVFWRSKPKCVHRVTGEPGGPPGGQGCRWGLWGARPELALQLRWRRHRA